MYHPGIQFPAVSLTGGACALHCEHCDGHYLQHMADASRGGSLPGLACQLKVDGAKGLLVSGGCDAYGKLPTLARMDELKTVKGLGLAINLHTGLVDDDEARRLADVVDVLSTDLHGSKKTIQDILHLPFGPEVYAESLSALCRAAPGRVVPHICLALEGDDPTNDMVSIDEAAKHPIRSLVLLRHLPTRSAPLRITRAMTDRTFLGLVRYAVEKCSRPVLIGCMRPRGNVRLELECVRAGVAGIAMPSASTTASLLGEGYEVRTVSGCCALHR